MSAGSSLSHELLHKSSRKPTTYAATEQAQDAEEEAKYPNDDEQVNEKKFRQRLQSYPPRTKQNKKNRSPRARHVVQPRPNQPAAVQQNNPENAHSVLSWLTDSGCKLVSLWIVLGAVDLLLLISTVLYLIRHNTPLNSHTQITYRFIGDIFNVLNALIILYLCWRFVNELLRGNFTQQQLQEYHQNDADIQAFAANRNAAALQHEIQWYQKINYVFKNLELNQFTVAALVCAIHQLFKATLLWIAVYNGASKWYIVSGMSFFLSAFSIPIPGVCFAQFVRFHHKQKKAALQTEHELYDLEATIISDLTKLIAIKHTIFWDSCVQILILFGFTVQLLQFLCLPTLNHDEVVLVQSVIYDCEGDINCAVRPDFVVCELVFRVFVAMAMLNNIVLLFAILSEQIHSETSLTHVFKIFHPVWYVLIGYAMLMDLRITDSHWTVEFRVVNGFWIAVHLCSLIVIFWLFTKFFTLNHRIIHSQLKRADIATPKSLFGEAVALSVLAITSTFFVSVDQTVFDDFLHHGNIIIWRQWATIVYHIAQIKIIHFMARIQKVPQFPSKLNEGHENKIRWEGCGAIKSCCVWLSLINLYDLVYSFMFEAREYNDVLNGNHLNDDEHHSVLLYKWAYSLSFAVCHLILWSLSGSIEFIVKYNQTQAEQLEQRRRARAQQQPDGYPQRKISVARSAMTVIDIRDKNDNKSVQSQ
mmetsp:Transcript_22169/g.35559  ORF Transcript_22169/g.35559 Transcript_22169/m.35559 type:complete len:701 (-) Transcript_22169:134-2236(-)|eukprot:CAMPEP_0197039610 /NCGR_PEP_ID=MMETSP1384-20130603/16385_1 /TAXON_ID=29189 /ORGANISM="Ammonia sp." /LENGTH=700 /DNA_ID=CAMNT_0042470231 /DNA_START=69 /DNA_END=2171 /DNA_ORIENTATION=-